MVATDARALNQSRNPSTPLARPTPTRWPGAAMAKSPKHIDLLGQHGVTRASIRYVRQVRQIVRVQFCWLHDAKVEHDCDGEGCWT